MTPRPRHCWYVWPEMLDLADAGWRIRWPERAGWKATAGARRGDDEFVRVGLGYGARPCRRRAWRGLRRDTAIAAIFGGSYGWSSAGRIHHARTLVRRFLFATGGATDQIHQIQLYGARDGIPAADTFIVLGAS